MVRPSTPETEETILRDGPVRLYLRADLIEAAAATLGDAGYAVEPVSCTTDDTLARDLRRALRWRETFGTAPEGMPNLNALHDALREHPSDARPRLALVLRDFGAFLRRDAPRASALLDVIATAERQHLLDGRRLVALVETGDPRAHFPDLGAHPAVWNNAEWMLADRGLA